MVFQCVSEPPRGRVSAELSKPVERKGAMCVVLEYSLDQGHYSPQLSGKLD